MKGNIMKKLKVGDSITFKGYGEDVPENDRLLEAGAEYAITEIDLKDKKVSVEIDNPDYNAKKKVSDENPKTLLVEVFEEEFDVAEEPEPAPKGRVTKLVTKAAAGKPVLKTPKLTPEEKEAAEAEAAAEALAAQTLDTEDEEIVKLVESSDDLLALAQELVEESAATDYKLGGVLYHVHKDKAYEKAGKKFRVEGGFELWVQENLNIEYRKAMALKQIYFAVNKFGVDPAKITDMGWTKAWKIAQVMDEDNVKDLVKLASNSTVADLVENIKVSYKEVGGTKGEKKKLIMFKFRLFEDSAEVVNAAIESCASSMGFKSTNEAFEHIVTEWATEHPMEAAEGNGEDKAERKRVTAPAAVPGKVVAKARVATPAARSTRH
jgi:hypothetical protein